MKHQQLLMSVLLSGVGLAPSISYAQAAPSSAGHSNATPSAPAAMRMAPMADMDGQSMAGMDMSGMKGMGKSSKKKAPRPGMKTMDSSGKGGSMDMPGMQGMQSSSTPAEPAGPAVGSLPRSDGSARHSYEHYGIAMGPMMHDMNGDPLISKFMLDQLEYVHGQNGGSAAWDGRFRIGYDINKIWIRSQGQRSHGKTQDADVELLWGHTVTPYWDVMSGVRHDFGGGPSRDWAAFGIQGLAPYLFFVEATAYVGPSGRTAARFKSEYDLLFTQRLILTPEVEANLYGRSDPARGIGAGVSDASLTFRLRYEISREFAPYIGFGWARKFGGTASYAQAAGEPVLDHQLIAGLRVWF
ncbi:copper resistance protein B [Thiomonas sp.]|uniref:copper resistance protein B n=1 Tax=Thiomonas sp. TaxID=2047785 RepID=UPI00258538BA|nr:copper resistance protein B [Thiomonas sp.]